MHHDASALSRSAGWRVRMRLPKRGARGPTSGTAVYALLCIAVLGLSLLSVYLWSRADAAEQRYATAKLSLGYQQSIFQNRTSACVASSAQISIDLELCSQSLRTKTHRLTQAQMATQLVQSAESANRAAVSAHSAVEQMRSTEALPPPRSALLPQPTALNGIANALGVSQPSLAASGVDMPLVIGIPTIPRHQVNGNAVFYLTQVIQALKQQIASDPADPLYGKVSVVVVFHQHSTVQDHAEFDKLKAECADKIGVNSAFTFVTKTVPLMEPGAKDRGDPNFPGAKVRQQTTDMAATVAAALEIFPVDAARPYVYFTMEDDMAVCPRALSALRYLVHKSTAYHQNWIAIRMSFGLNGIILHSEDMAEVFRYLNKHRRRRPPDHLMVEWMAAEKPESRAYVQGRKLIAFKFSLLLHLGRVSTLRDSLSPSFPVCYEKLGEPVNFEVESFHPRACPRDDIWPCQVDSTLPVVDFSKTAR